LLILLKTTSPLSLSEIAEARPSFQTTSTILKANP
jgi:hypothetical protein